MTAIEGDDGRKHAARLAHDVGKYVARAARNIRDGEPVPGVLADMLARDLYALDHGARASEVFERLARPLAEVAASAGLDRARALLGEIDALEERVRERDDAAVRRAARLACDVESVLRDLAREAR